MQALYLLAQKKMKLPGCQMQGCHRQLDGRNLGSKCFVFPLAGPVRSQRLQGKGCPERKRRIHQAKPWALFGEGVGTAGPHAGSGRCRRLTRFLFLNLCCSITRQWTQEGFSYRQQVKSSVGQKRVLRDVFGFMPRFYMDLRMAESTSAFWGGLVGFFFFFLPPLLNGCLVSHLLYKTFMPLQKCSFSCVGLVVMAYFLVVCKITESQDG